MTEIEASTLDADTLLAAIDTGGETVITRGGVPVARLVPIAPAFDREKAREAVEGLLKASRSGSLGGLKIKDLIEEGRR